MKCSKARASLEKDPALANTERAVREHLNSCPDCAEFRRQMDLTWEAMSAYPTIEPSPDFARRFEARLRNSEQPRAGWSELRPAVGWQWMALAACALILGLQVLVKSPDAYGPAKGEISRTDRLDERLLQDIDQSLSRSDGNYLPMYDEWEGIQSDSSPVKLPGRNATERKKTS